MACVQDLTCLIFPFRWACFPIKIGRNAQWVHLFSMDFEDFLTIYLIFDGKSISQWEHYIPLIKGCDAIRPALNCFILIISVDTLCGFAPLHLFKLYTALSPFSVILFLVPSPLLHKTDTRGRHTHGNGVYIHIYGCLVRSVRIGMSSMSTDISAGARNVLVFLL